MTDKEKLEAWERAYLTLHKYGHIGRMLEGTVHNLNGILQAFSMQTELFELMFSKFRKQLIPLFDESLSPLAIESINTVLELVDKREKMLAPMSDKVAYSQEIIKNTGNICHRPSYSDVLSLQVLLHNIVNFYDSDMYFKHKVKVNFDLQSDFKVDSICSDLALVFQNIIQNAITSLVLENSDQPILHLTCDEDDSHLHVHIKDNGGGVDLKVRDTLFESFVSAWDEQPGLGLYFCQQICNNIKCSIRYKSNDDWTDFIVTIPK